MNNYFDQQNSIPINTPVFDVFQNFLMFLKFLWLDSDALALLMFPDDWMPFPRKKKFLPFFLCKTYSKRITINSAHRTRNIIIKLTTMHLQILFPINFILSFQPTHNFTDSNFDEFVFKLLFFLLIRSKHLLN